MDLTNSIISFFTSLRTNQGVCGGFKAIGTVSADTVLPHMSYIQNRGADGQTLNYEDEYGNTGSITMTANEITPARIAKVLNGSGASMYRIYYK